MNKLSIIIINWNSGNLLANCVNSVLNSDIETINFEIIIVDNASVDSSLMNIPVNSQIQIIKNKTNIGFGAACNMAFKEGVSEYYLLLNPDTEVFNSTLKDSVQFMDVNPEISVLGIKQVDQNGNVKISCSRFPKVRNFFNDILGLSKFFPKIFKPATLMRDWDHKNSAYVDQVMGAFMLIRNKNLKKVGFMDTRFFVYFEDLDLSKRIKDTGGKIYYHSGIEVYHYGGGTSENVKAHRLFYSLRSRLLYGKKHFNFVDILFLHFLTLFIEPVTRIVFSFFSFKFKDAKQTLFGFSMLYRSIFRKKS